MKGVIVAALQALKKFSLLDNASIIVYFTGDEERWSTH
jgi:acetylornithine deacetylase/succinyl-diaminopimelate desuccinylase-like protein